MQIRNFWIDIENGSGVKQGRGPIRTRGFTITKPLSSAGRFSFEVSAASPNISALVEKKTAICRYINAAGAIAVFGGGVIDKIEIQAGADGRMVYVVSGNDLAGELSYRSVGALMLASGAAGVTNGPTQIMALAPAGWSVVDGLTVTAVYAGFDGETVLNALVRVGEHVGEHWRLGSGRQIVWLGPASGFGSSGVRAVQHINDPAAAESQTGIAVIASLKEIRDASAVISRAIPRGSGNGSTIITLAAATASAPAGYTLDQVYNYLKNNAGETAYGRIERTIDFKEIGPLSNTTADVQSAGNMLLQAAYEYLERHASAQRFYELELKGVNQALEPGTTMRVVYRKILDGTVLYDLDSVLNLVEVEQSIDATGLHTTRVVVSTADRLPKDDTAILAEQVQNGRIVSTHQQLSASVDNIGWRDEMDAAHAAGFRFWLGQEYTSLQQALFRFRIQPLRTTITTVGGTSTTTASGGGGTSTSSSGGGQTASGGAHGHMATVHDGAFDYDMGVKVAAGLAGLYASSGAGDTNLEVGVNSSHDHTIAAHTHNVDIPAHTHELTAAIESSYGLFEESLVNTLGLADLVIKLNGGANLAGSVLDIGNGWYALDLTASLVDSVFRPSQDNNELEISTATADKTARIEAQLTIRGVVQAVAYL